MNTEAINKVKSIFIDTFKSNPLMIFSPGRINIIGEHTDYNDGFVFPAAIDKGIYAAIGKSNSNESTIYALDLNDSFTFSVDDSECENCKGWKNYIFGVVAEIQKKDKTFTNFNLVFSGDIPEGAGLSSSAALENSVVFGLNELFNLDLTKEEMIYISQKAEHNYVGVKCGIMDQYASMFGQKDKALLLDCRSLKAQPYSVNLGDYQLLLINTNVKHNLSDSAYNNRREVCEKVAKMLSKKALRDATEDDLNKIKSNLDLEDYYKALYVIKENERVKKAAKAIENKDIKKLGNLLFETHDGLKNNYKVSCSELDFLVDKAKETDSVIGARMMGGGFGGCTINIIDKKTKETFIKDVAEAYKNKFNTECSFYNVMLEEGTHVI
ncbi:galactokinase [Tenacibaculum sp. UWU-22]|uniref:galactokinase n=1 Tax=Tenacibaculum sp. UWU-22 TaxID=3234187 RepID=UPI0034DB5320